MRSLEEQDGCLPAIEGQATLHGMQQRSDDSRVLRALRTAAQRSPTGELGTTQSQRSRAAAGFVMRDKGQQHRITMRLQSCSPGVDVW